MNFNRNRAGDKRALNRLHDNAVRLATTPGTGRVGIASSGAPNISSVAQTESGPDATGATLEGLMRWGDNWGSAWSN